MKLNSNVLFAAFICVCLSWAGQAAEFFIRNGDRVAFLGDSITEQRLYTTYIEAYVLTRHPGWNVTFRNVGWAGDTSWLRRRSAVDDRALFAAAAEAQQRMVEAAVRRGLGRDVLPLKPTAVTINFGMNDHNYEAFRPDIFQVYMRSQSELVKVLKASGARVAFLTPQPIEDKRPDPDKDIRNQSIRRFSDGLKEVAAKSGSVYVDQFDPYMSMLLRERRNNPSGMIGGGYSLHPGPIGQTVMAWAILKGLGACADVSRAVIDAVAVRRAAAENCTIYDIQVSAGKLSFSRTDAALPMPIDERARPALTLAPVLRDLSRYELKVTGLAAGKYELRIDDEATGQVTAEELQDGWDLTLSAGPISRQAAEVLALVFEKNSVFTRRWRYVQLYVFPSWARTEAAEKLQADELARLDNELARLEKRIDEARQPKSHRFELARLAE